MMVMMLAVTGCESTSQTVSQHKETAVGAGVGAAGGAVVGGLAAATVTTLFILPSMYAMLRGSAAG